MKTHYIIGLPEWQMETTADVEAVLAERLKFVRSLGLKGYSSIRWSIGGKVEGKDEMMAAHVANHLWFEDKASWQEACAVLDADERFEWKPLSKPEQNERVRIYKLVAPRAKIN